MKGLLLAITAALFLSVTNITTALHYEAGSTPMTFLVGRYLLFVIFTMIVLLFLRKLQSVPLPILPHAIVAGTLNAAGAVALGFAFARIEVGLAVLLLYLYPLMTELLVAGLDRRRPDTRIIVALCLMLAGLTLALDVRRPALDPYGVALAVLAAFAFSTSFIWTDRTLYSLSNSMRVLTLGSVGLVFVIVLAGVLGGVVWPLPSQSAVITLIAATSSFSFAYVALFAAIAALGSTLATRMMNLEPPVTLGLAWLILNESLSALQIMGCGIVLASLIGSKVWVRSVEK